MDKDSTNKLFDRITQLSKEIYRLDKRIEHLSLVKEDKIYELKEKINKLGDETNTTRTG